MILHCGLLLLFLNCVRTTENVYDHELIANRLEFDRNFSFWPSVHNGATLMRIRKREIAEPQASLSEGGDVLNTKQSADNSPQPSVPKHKPKNETETANPAELPKVSVSITSNANETAVTPLSVPPVPQQIKANETIVNTTTVNQKEQNQLDLNNPGVVKRGAIVFGGFALLAIAYFIFYRQKNKNDTNNTHSIIDQNQFRYGVLQSEDKRDNMELSRVPLTMESDDDDDDEDLEIFDLGQKKKSLSYVNLQTNDEDVVYGSLENSAAGNDRDNLLLDIEDRASDTLINWKASGDKSIL